MLFCFHTSIVMSFKAIAECVDGASLCVLRWVNAMLPELTLSTP